MWLFDLLAMFFVFIMFKLNSQRKTKDLQLLVKLFNNPTTNNIGIYFNLNKILKMHCYFIQCNKF